MKITDLTPQFPEEISLPEPAPATPAPARKAKATAPVVVVPATEQVGELAIVDASKFPLIAAADKDGLIAKINERIEAFAPDLSAPGWQDQCRSLAYDIAKTGSAVDKIRLGLTEGYRKSTKAVNDEGNLLKGWLDERKEAVRRPLTAWEKAEEARKADHEAALADIRARVEFESAEPTAEEIRARLTYAEAVGNRDWQEFADQASQARADAVDKLNSMLVTAERREAEQAELEQLRAERAERDRQEAIRIQAERERKAAEEAAERARKAVEAEAARIAAERAAYRANYHSRMLQHVKDCGRGLISGRPQPVGILQYELTTKIEYNEEQFGDLLPEALVARDEALNLIQRAADEDARRLAEEDAQAEIRRQEEAAARERQIEADRIAAAEQAKRDAEAAVEAERKRVAYEKAAESAEAERRARSNRHKGKINNEALADLMAAGLDEATGKKVIESLARGQVRHCAISY